MLTGKNVVITGCNRGIGKAIMYKCAEYGSNIWACMRKNSGDAEAGMNMLQDKYGVKIIPVYFDICDEEAVKKGTAQILSSKLPIDAIVNNAGMIGADRLFSMTTMQEIRDVFDVNFFGPMLLTQSLLKNMIRKKRGSIVNMASVAAMDGEPAPFGYAASKAAVIGATKKLSGELAQFGIRINAIAPGLTDTDMVKEMKEDLLAEEIQNTKLKRMGTPLEIAELAAFLVSDRSSFITGQVIRVDGGRM